MSEIGLYEVNGEVKILKYIISSTEQRNREGRCFLPQQYERLRGEGGDRGTINWEGEERSNNYDVSVWVERRRGSQIKMWGRHSRSEA